MSFRRSSLGRRSSSVGRQQKSQMCTNDSDIDSATINDTFQNILPELMKYIRKLLPQELPFNMHVHSVEYIESGCPRLTGTLYMTTFRLVFAPDEESENNNLISSGNKYIGEYDIPLTSIYKINVAPVDARSGFKSFLNENQIQSETRTFTIITRDFRNITFTKCSVTKSNTLEVKSHHVPVTKMESYINTLRDHSRSQTKEELYPYIILKQNSMRNSSPRANRSFKLSTMTFGQSIDDDASDFCVSNDERIRSYMTYEDWRDELYEANDQQWVIDRKKFDDQQIIKDEGPYVYLVNSHEHDGFRDLIWHWTHTSQVENDNHYHQNRRQVQAQKYMLVTVPGIGEISTPGDPVESPMALPATPSSSPFRFFNIKKKLPKPLRPNTTNGPKLICTNETKVTTSGLTALSQMPPADGLRRATTDTNLVYSSHVVFEQPFQRYNLAKFPCNLKRLQTSYEKLIELCVITPENDDEKWWTKLNTCKWLKYVSKTLHGAASLAKLLNFKNIELSGSDTDNSCLMSSLIQILLRPKCRTIKGFCELIVREWIIRGHRFCERFGQISHDLNGYPVQEAPVFLLFLDCVYQLTVQNPFAFEFSDYFLLELYHDVCYCYHHTFAFNNVIERLEAIYNRPKNLLILSSFDFSLYLYPDACRLLKNDASIFNSQKFISSPSRPKTKSRIEATVVYPTTKENSPQFPRRPNRTVYILEAPKSADASLDIPITNGSLTLTSDHYDYDIIESPQIFTSDLHVDWRTCNLILWSKCYCRYDQNYMPTLREQQLALEINCLKEDIEKVSTKSKRHMTLDTFHSVGNANSWHPQALDTRV